MRSVPGVAYGAAMTVTAGMAGLATRIPCGPPAVRGLRDRLGAFDSTARGAAAAAPALWVHAASVGEVVAVRALLGPLRERFPGRQLVVSTVTRTGLALAGTFAEVHATTLFPLDAPVVVRRILRAFRLEAFLFTETEIWPNFLVGIARASIPAIMVSGRVTPRTVARARWLGGLYPEALAHVTCCMQSDADAQRVIQLGAEPRRVYVTGSLKDAGADAAVPPEVAALREAISDPPRRLIIAGSTHPGENEALIAAYLALLPGRPELVLVLAPRHPAEMERVAGLVADAGLPLERMSAQVPHARLAPGARVILLDVMGRLAAAYHLAAVTFVGGSLVPIGGHNVLEPARAGRAILVGPYTDHARATVDRLASGGGLRVLPDTEALAPALARILDDPLLAAEMGARARALAADGRGTIERHMKIIAARVSASTFARFRDERA